MVGMLRFDIITIFPEFFQGPLEYGILRRARERALVEVQTHDLRRFTHDRHQVVDDRPFGGGEGMVLKPEPLFEAVESLGIASKHGRDTTKERVLLMSASGELLSQTLAAEFVKCERLALICGRYEGVDERVAEHLADMEVSVGDFVLSGGEIAAALIIDAVVRLLPGALGNEASQRQDSFSNHGGSPAQAGVPDSTIALRGLLDYPHYTRPARFREWPVPEILSSGDHAKIRNWRKQQAFRKTLANRPDLLDRAKLSIEDVQLLHALKDEQQ
ncbi:MAG: tRNA (guanosine(37)-N1)-methyltransferase TrmD [Acidobacteriaceae bacterium]